MTNETINEGNGNSRPNWREIVAVIVGILILGGFAGFVIYLISHTGEEDLAWSRLVYLFAGIEAMTFTVVGYIFGSEVNRKRAENAEASQDDANSRASYAEKRAVAAESKGKALLMAIETKMKNRVSAPTAVSAAAQDDDVWEISALAKQLFGE